MDSSRKFLCFTQGSLGEIHAAKVIQSGGDTVRVADSAKSLDRLAPHLFRPHKIALLIVEAGKVGQHHGFAVDVSCCHGALQRDLTFADCVGGPSD